MGSDTSLDTSEALMAVYKTATQQHLMTLIKHDHEREQYKQIAEETKSRLRTEEQDWNTQYDQRLAEAQQIILREAHGNILEPPKPSGIDKVPNSQALLAQADARICKDHEDRKHAIRQDELDQYEKLREKLGSRDQQKGRAMNEFDRARSGPNRS